jgi:uncharacterized iron-regulated membrane protein
MIRPIAVLLHRWIGLTTAAFLIIVGLTGSLLAFLPELDRLIAPKLFPGPHGAELDPATLLRRAEALAPGMRANTIYLGYRGTAQVGVEPLPGAPEPAFDQIYLDSVTGEELARVKRKFLPQSAGEIMPFIYRLHYALLLGDIGEWCLGLIALAWTLDCFIAFYLTLPATGGGLRRGFFARWKPAWTIKTKSSTYRLNFDLHRAGGLWLWGLLLIFAWSSVFMDLNGFYTQTMRLFFDLDQPVWARPAPEAKDDRPPMSFEAAQERARALIAEQAAIFGFSVEAVDAFYLLREKGLYEYRVRSSRDIGDKYGATALHFDSRSGALVNVSIPTGRRAGDTITSWLIALHMADVFGLPYKILVCALGVAIAGLSVTGVYIWLRKRKARLAHPREKKAPA